MLDGTRQCKTVLVKITHGKSDGTGAMIGLDERVDIVYWQYGRNTSSLFPACSVVDTTSLATLAVAHCCT